MEIREITTYSENAPFTGYGVCIVFEMRYRQVRLLHPSTLGEMLLQEYEFVEACGNQLWPFNNSGISFSVERFKRSFKERVKFSIENKRSIPFVSVCQVISELDEISVQEAEDYVNSLAIEAEEEVKRGVYSLDKHDRRFILRKDADYSRIVGRPLAIIQALQNSPPATMSEIKDLVDGKLKTKCKLSRAVTYFVNKLTSQGILEIVV